MPRRTRFTTTEKNRSSTKNPKIIDSSPRFAARTLESGLHAGLTSPARPWLRLTVADQKLAENEGVKNWLHVTTQRMLAIFQMTNLYQVLPNVYGDMGVFGMGAMSILEDDEDLFRCYRVSREVECSRGISRRQCEFVPQSCESAGSIFWAQSDGTGS